MSEPAKPRPTPFEKFDALMRKIASAPRAEVEKRMENAKKERQKKRES